MIYFSTLENEVLIPNLKIVDLIFLNPTKYKKLKVLTTNSNYSALAREDKYEKGDKNEKDFTSKRYDVLQSTSDYLEDKDANKVNYGLYKFNEEANIKSNSNISDFNLPKEKAVEPSTDLNATGEYKFRSEAFLNLAKDKEIQHKMNYLKSKNNSLQEDDYLKQNYDEYSYNNNSNNMNSNINNTNKTSLELTKQDTIPASSTATKNLSNYDYKNYYDNKESSYPKPSNSSKLNTAGKKYDYGANLGADDLDSKAANSTLSKNYSTKYISYGDNNTNEMLANNKEIIERSKSNLNMVPFTDKAPVRKETATTAIPNTTEETNRASNIYPNSNEYNMNKYNYSERVRDDVNRVRYSSEKRNFRNNQFCK